MALATAIAFNLRWAVSLDRYYTSGGSDTKQLPHGVSYNDHLDRDPRKGQSMRHIDRRNFLTASAIFGGSAVLGTSLLADDPTGAGGLIEPVARIAKSDVPMAPSAAAHPLDAALKIAHSSLQHIRQNIVDYSAILIKRELIDGALTDYEYMGIKIRNRKHVNGVMTSPFSVYMAFLKPATVKGREVIYVENQNNGNIVAHEGGMKGRFLPTVNLDPLGMMAMRGQRYPITDLGLENLVVKLIEKGDRDRQRGECDVQFQQGAKVGGRECTVLSVTHPVARPYFDFHIAQIFIDDELNVPVRYCAYSWPHSAGGEPVLLEEYTYQNIKTNIGLTDADFDQRNSKYNF